MHGTQHRGGTGHHSLKGLVAMALLALVLGAQAGAQTYSITDLGTLGGESSEASGLNNLGQVVGWSTTASGETHGFLYANNTMTDLGTLVGGTYSFATAINDRSQVVGYGGINGYGPGFREIRNSFLWARGSIRALSGFYCVCSFNERYPVTAAHGINAAGQIVGKAKTLRSASHAYLWQDDLVTDLDEGPSSSSASIAFGINGLGQVVGVRDGRAFLWQNGEMRDLGALPGGQTSLARAINVRGQVVGEADVFGGLDSHAFLWQGGTMQDLGTLPGDHSSRARAINAAGQVVGESVGADGASSRAFLWQDGLMRDLNLLIPPGARWVLTKAAAINDAGQIAGTGLHDGAVRAFLLTPGVPPQE
jgi:probable HAF family extracellular repeat protein